MTQSDPWLSLEDAAKQVNRSVPTIKRLVRRRLVAKRLAPRPGKKAQAQVYMPDLDRIVSDPVHIPAVEAGPKELDQSKNGKSRSDLLPAVVPARTGPENLGALVEKFEQWLRLPRLGEKLVWTLKEARSMSGLTGPALKELIRKDPNLAIRHGRRVWIRSGRLRSMLS